MLTIEDIRNPDRKSGFEHVQYHADRDNGSARPYKAQFGSRPSKPGGKGGEQGPRRFTAEEAALDYCDYVNSGRAVFDRPVLKRVQRDNFVAKNRQPRKPKSDEILRLEAELRAAREAHYESGPTDCYLVSEKVVIPQDVYYVKIGYAGDEATRVSGMQTGNPRDLLVLALLDGTEERDGKEIERELHALHIECNHRNEWFEATPEILASFGLTWIEFLTMIEKTDERAHVAI